jgi:hypothetical protein
MIITDRKKETKENRPIGRIKIRPSRTKVDIL